MIAELGHFALWLALALALVTGTVPLIGAQKGRATWMALARPAAVWIFLLVGFTFVALTIAFMRDEFLVENLDEHAMHSEWFEVPPSWQGRRVLVTFKGVSSAFYLWVNGTKVGYSEDSRTPAEFDHTRRQAGAQPAGGGGLPLFGRRLPGVPGLLATVGHLPRRGAVVAHGRAHR